MESGFLILVLVLVLRRCPINVLRLSVLPVQAGCLGELTGVQSAGNSWIFNNTQLPLSSGTRLKKVLSAIFRRRFYVNFSRTGHAPDFFENIDPVVHEFRKPLFLI